MKGGFSMLDVPSALRIAEKRFPDKKLNGNPAEFNGKYAFNMIPKDNIEPDNTWNSFVVAVDRESGEISTFNAFENLDFLMNGKPILSY
jgi:hypothetical protein